MRRHPTPFHSRMHLLLLFAVSACGPHIDDAPPEAAAATITVVDATGTERHLRGPAQRIVSLVPSATSTLRALGVESRLVGRTDFDTAPWMQILPSVGGGLDPNLEEIVALQPDLVIRFAGEQDPRTPARLDDLGITHFALRPDRLEDAYTSITQLGALTGSEQAADAVVAEIRAELDALRSAVASRPRLRTVYVLGGTPPWVAGSGTYIDDILSLSGGDNVFSDLGSLYASVSPEQIRAREIDVVLVSSAGDFDPTLAPGARIVEVGGTLEIPGPGTAEAAWRLAELLHATKLR